MSATSCPSILLTKSCPCYNDTESSLSSLKIFCAKWSLEFSFFIQSWMSFTRAFTLKPLPYNCARTKKFFCRQTQLWPNLIQFFSWNSAAKIACGESPKWNVPVCKHRQTVAAERDDCDTKHMNNDILFTLVMRKISVSAQRRSSEINM